MIATVVHLIGSGCGPARLSLPPALPSAHEVAPGPGDPDRGRALLRDRRLGRSGFSCADCHPIEAGRARPGPPLGAVGQGAWRGQAESAAVAINLCVERYQARPPLGPRVLGSLLAAVAALPAHRRAPEALAPELPPSLSGGDEAAGRALYRRACRHCHEGGPAGGLVGQPLGSEALARRVRRLDRPRHPGGFMPAFGRAVLNDAALVDLVAFLSGSSLAPPIR